jgi:hypothetical protein
MTFPPMPTDKYGTRSPVESSAPINIPGVNPSGRRTTISIDDTLQSREYSISYADRRRSRSRTLGSPPPRSRTPFPHARRSSSQRRSKSREAHESTSCPNDLMMPGENTSGPVPPTILTPQDRVPPAISFIQQPSPERPGSCVCSSEYLEKYHPVSAESRVKKYVPGKPEAILEKIKRMKVGQGPSSIGGVAEDVVKRRRWEKTESMGRAKRETVIREGEAEGMRGDLQRELRSLFNEE